MKLNGKHYIQEQVILNTIEDIIISLETGDYRAIAESIVDIKIKNAENVAEQLARFQDMYKVHFKQEKYCKLEVVLQIANDTTYDSKLDKIGIFTTGSYGVTIRADDKSVERYVFNTCIYVFMKRVKEINGSNNI
ncbi:MAG: hypothetical protein CBC02_008345 [Flavobacteriaceae bacterium TMED42]|nr:MAG: hypothetical protein CBC02_008345 [Flavobacteriaceae bacterium TMED42]|tara:strand:- start:517 stop:921 length:405 start_codon:yes stop_codon:yes gene_type:complete